jgi:protein SCO1
MMRTIFLIGLTLIQISFAASESWAEDTPSTTKRIEFPDVHLTNQNGQEVSIRELVKDRAVAISTIFTSCTTVCPVMGANLSRVSRVLAEKHIDNAQLISISIDPETDTPERLRTWIDKFGPHHDWTLLTGTRVEVTRLLKALDLYAADKTAHTPLLLIGSDATNIWTRVDGTAAPSKIVDVLSAAAESALRVQRAANYFGNTEVVDQDGKHLRFYDDLLKGKVVIIDTFFTQCEASCPRMSGVLAGIQGRLGSRLGEEVNLISISVDPANDTPERLKDYALRFNARPGWHFVTGDSSNMRQVLAKFGQQIDKRDDHLNLFYIGNERSGLWKKAFALSPAEEIMKVVDSIVHDGE